MKLLLDQDVYELTARYLHEIGHDVLKVSEIGMAAAKDEDNLRKASELGRIFITRNRDYGNLVFVRNLQIGVLYLRMLPSNQVSVHTELHRVLEMYSDLELSIRRDRSRTAPVPKNLNWRKIWQTQNSSTAGSTKFGTIKMPTRSTRCLRRTALQTA